MIYVPVVPPQPPSPRTRELADLLARVIEEYEKHHPSVTGPEIRAALQMASQSSKAAAPAALLLGVSVLLLVAGMAVFFFVGPQASGAIPWNAVVMVVAGVLAAGFLVARLARK